jgi:hypothetical protein
MLCNLAYLPVSFNPNQQFTAEYSDTLLGGTCVHNDRLEWVDGELIPTGSEFSTEKILVASGSGKKLLMKIGNENSADSFPLEFTLTAPGQAEARITAPSDSGVPPQKKPWHLQRVSVTP